VRSNGGSFSLRRALALALARPAASKNISFTGLFNRKKTRAQGDARVHGAQLVTLEEQDRSVWDQREISEGLMLVEKALSRGPVGPYQLQAAIAALHAQAKTPQETDWRQIAALYERLLEFNRSPVIALNHAVAVAMSAGFEEGLKIIDALGASGELDRYYLFHAARADILRRMNRQREAKEAYRQALALATNRIEQDFLKRRL
jgi:RNA polymerase sigma-70 factor (ECF subfamily)